MSVVLPTFNRAPALQDNLRSLLALEGVLEFVVVDDGSTDDTAAVLAAHDDSRLRVVRLEANAGQPTARNAGVETSRGDWVLFAEDDCRFPADYARVLRSEADAHAADVVGAPFVYPSGPEDVAGTIERGRARPVPRVTIDRVGRFPAAPTRTPFMPATALVRRTVFEAVRFDERYRGNAWREETAFFVAAARLGFVCLLTPATAAYQLQQYRGGARRQRLSYEYWTLRNNWRFLRLHGGWLADEGHIRSSSVEQLELMGRRVSSLTRGYFATRVLGRG